MCGFFGVVGSENSACHEIYEALISLQHRGQDAAGIVTHDDRFHLKKGNGLVRDVFRLKNMERLTGSSGIGQVRYPTFGGSTTETHTLCVISLRHRYGSQWQCHER